jgi:hypothetical protein
VPERISAEDNHARRRVSVRGCEMSYISRGPDRFPARKPDLIQSLAQHQCVPKTLNPPIAVMKSAKDGA